MNYQHITRCSNTRTPDPKTCISGEAVEASPELNSGGYHGRNHAPLCSLHRWRSQWLLSLLILCLGVGLGLGVTSDTQAGSRKGGCGGNSQRACHVWEALPSCDSGLKESGGKCVGRPGHCGRKDQRPCTVVEFIPSCESELAQDFLKNKCVDDAIGKIVVDVFDATGKVVGQCTGGVDKCADQIRQGYLAAGKTVTKLGQPVMKKAGEVAVKGLQEAEKLGKKLLEEGLEPFAKEVWSQFSGPFISLADAVGKVVASQEIRNLGKAIDDGDGPAIGSNLEKILAQLAANAPWRDAVAHFKSKGFGSILIIPSASVGAVVTGTAYVGIAVDIDYVDYLIRKHNGESVSYDYDANGNGRVIGSVITAAGLQVGPAAGAGVNVNLGYHIAEPHQTGGPSIDVGISVKVGVGGGFGVGFDASKFPPQAVTAAIAPGVGAEVKFPAIGPSFTFIVVQLCHDGKLVGGVAKNACPKRGTGTGSNPGNDTDNDLSGQYRIRVKATNTFWHEDGCCSKLVSTRWQPNDDYTRFILEKQSDGSYRIKVKADNRYLHVDTSSDKILSTRYQVNDDFTRFFFEKQSDGSYRIKLKATNRYLHQDESSDKMLSTRWQPNDDHTRFFLDKEL